MSGGDSIEEVRKLYNQLRAMLSQAKFELGKWKTNCAELIDEINADSSHDDQPLELNEEDTSILGLNWQPNSDCFTFKIEEQWSADKIVTKRTVSSAVARIYDPNGYLAPIVITAKAFLQELWKVQSGRDDPLEQSLAERWREYYKSLSAINELKIPRWIQTTQGRQIELIGFADASEIGYGAVVYVRCASDKFVWCNLLTAKTKVAPVKTVTIPRLELCAAELLSKLMKRVRKKCELEYVQFSCYSDSSITLNWISKCP